MLGAKSLAGRADGEAASSLRNSLSMALQLSKEVENFKGQQFAVWEVRHRVCVRGGQVLVRARVHVHACTHGRAPRARRPVQGQRPHAPCLPPCSLLVGPPAAQSTPHCCPSFSATTCAAPREAGVQDPPAPRALALGRRLPLCHWTPHAHMTMTMRTMRVHLCLCARPPASLCSMPRRVPAPSHSIL